MAINKAMQAALKALSYPDFNVKKNYKIERQFINVAHYHYTKPLIPAYRIWDHQVSCGDHTIPVRLFSPPGKKWNRVLLFFHGGGWVTGNIDSYDRVCVDMSRLTDSLVVSVDYRLAPEYRFPAAPEDCYAVAKEVFSHAALLNTIPENITLIGDSAGGNLAAVVSLMARDRKEFFPKKQILIYPATYNNHSETAPFASIHENGQDYLLTSKKVSDYMDLYIQTEEDRQNPYFAPYLADCSEQPDTFIITAEYDPLRDEGEAYGRKLKEQGNAVRIYRMMDALHGFFSLPASFSQVKQAYILINSFLNNGITGVDGR